MKKALRQLGGAYKRATRSGSLTLETDKRTVELDLSKTTVHLIVLVSENHPDLANGTFPEDVLSVGESLGVGVHILDLGSLSGLLRSARDARSFLRLLDRRWQASVQYRVIRFADD